MLTIVIPALNEEQSIQAIARRCLEAGREILDRTGEEIEVIVVDDGSTDRTAELAGEIEGVRVLSLGRNRGYGAALRAGFRLGRGDLVGFLDADGTCDPLYFIPMIRAVRGGASVALGNRLGRDSEMPKVRRLGNRFFAWLIRRLSGAEVQDSASGMRVLTREALACLEPLPDGLHFTPAMSCKAALDPRLSLAEVPMPYAERQGRSKLGVVRDGFRFLRVILETSISWRPLLFFGTAGLLMLLTAGLYAISPVLTWVRTGGLPPDRVYRVFTILVLSAGGLGFLYAGALADRAQALVNPPRPRSWTSRLLERVLFRKPFLLAILCLASALLTNARALYQYLSTGAIQVHWATIAFGALFTLAALELLAFGVLQHVLSLLSRARPRESEEG